MLVRVWTLLLAVMLLASPSVAGADIEAPTESEVFSDDVLVQRATDLAAATPARAVVVPIDESLPQMPALGRVFRPPRPLVN